MFRSPLILRQQKGFHSSTRYSTQAVCCCQLQLVWQLDNDLNSAGTQMDAELDKHGSEGKEADTAADAKDA